MFEQLDFVYQPSRDVAADLGYYLDTLGAELIFAIQRFGTRVAMLRLAPNSPRLLLAEHLAGEQSLLIFRVPDLDLAERAILERGGRLGPRFEMPFGIGTQLMLDGPQRLAIYQETQRDRGDSLTGRRDF
jgi:hypothetical protein